MKNIHALPTDKPSRLQLFEGINEFEFELCSKDSFFNKGVHIYITSDEEIKYGDYYISILENEVYKATKETQNIMSVANLIRTTTYKNTHFKIILTTDPDLIKDGVQAIPDEFLEWFVKNPSCEEVVVEYWQDDLDGIWQPKYSIIIPKEGPKQETLEEVANKNNGYLLYAKDTKAPIFNEGFIAGYQLAQQQNKNLYSEEDLHNAFYNGWIYRGDGYTFPKAKQEWFNQFKKQ